MHNATTIKNKSLFIATIIEGLVLLFCLVIYFRPMENVVLDADSLTVPTGAVRMESLMNDKQSGWYIDNSMDMSEGVITVTTNPVNLHFGSFLITLKYATDDHNNTYDAISTYNTWPVITSHTDAALSDVYSADEGDFDNMLDSRSEATFRLDSWQNVSGYQIRFNYKGNGYLYVSGIEIHETLTFKNVLLFWTIVLYLIFLLLYSVISRHYGIGKYAITLSAVFVLCSLPLTGPYLSYGHDLPFHLARIEGVATAIKSGQFPVRVPYLWNNGYGYASSIFYSDLYLLFPALLRMIGITVQGAYKAYVLAINVGTCLITFYCFNRVLHNRKAAIVSTAAYALSPYRICCIYVRAAVGEYSAMTFLPLVILGMYDLYQDSSNKNEKLKDVLSHSMPLILGISAIIECHILSCVILMIYIFIVAVLKIKRTFTKTVLRRIFTSIVGVLLLNAWFVVPMIDFMQDKFNVDNMRSLGRFGANGAFPWQVFSLFPSGSGTSYSVAEGLGSEPEMSYSIGGGIIIGILVWVFISTRKDISKDRTFLISKWRFGLGLLFTLMAVIWFPWDFVQQLGGIATFVTQSIQFPFRFLGIATALLSLVCGSLIIIIKNNKPLYHWYAPVMITMMAFCVVSASYEIDDIERNGTWIYEVNDNDVDMNSIGTEDYIPVGTDMTIFNDLECHAGDGIDVFDMKKNEGTVTIDCSNSSVDSYVDVPLLYYRGYTAKEVGIGKKLQVIAGEGMRVRVVIPAGFDGTINVKFSEPWSWRICEIVSILAALAVITGVITNAKSGKRAGIR